MSICRYCGHDVVWIKRPNSEAYFPPFEDSHQLGRLDYEVTWDEEMGDWRAAPVDKALTVKLAPHRCEARLQKIAQDRAERDAKHAMRMAAYETGVDTDDLPANVEPVIRTEVRYVERWRDPAPEKLITVALRLRERCPTCGAMPFVWCHYKLAPDELTTQLHTMRRVNGGREPMREDG